MTSTAARGQIVQLAGLLSPPYWQTRQDGNGVALIAGSGGYAKAVWGGVILVLRPAASGELRRRLIQAGVLTPGLDSLRLARHPEADEVQMLRDLLGLQRELVRQ